MAVVRATVRAMVAMGEGVILAMKLMPATFTKLRQINEDLNQGISTQVSVLALTPEFD